MSRVRIRTFGDRYFDNVRHKYIDLNQKPLDSDGVLKTVYILKYKLCNKFGYIYNDDDDVTSDAGFATTIALKRWRSELGVFFITYAILLAYYRAKIRRKLYTRYRSRTVGRKMLDNWVDADAATDRFDCSRRQLLQTQINFYTRRYDAGLTTIDTGPSGLCSPDRHIIHKEIRS